jgi:hypothetical protein
MRFNDMKDDEILRQYLLGSLDEEQADDLERRLLNEGELFELAEAVEGDLLMAAARGELSPAERGRVLRRLAASPEGRARYALARGLISLERVPAEVVAFRLLSRPGVRAAAVAASLAFVAGGFWLATQTVMPRGANMIARGLPTAPAAGRPAPAAPPSDRIAEHSPAPAPPVSPENYGGSGREPSARPEPAPLIFQLALATLRGPGGESRPLEIPPGLQRVEIQLPLLPDEPSTSFAAVLRNASTGEEIRREDQLAAREAGGQKMIVLSVPAADLAPGTYEVEVRGITNGEDELLGKPTFEVASN